MSTLRTSNLSILSNVMSAGLPTQEYHSRVAAIVELLSACTKRKGRCKKKRPPELYAPRMRHQRLSAPLTARNSLDSYVRETIGGCSSTLYCRIL